MDFCKFRSMEEPSGPYAIKLPQKAREALASRDFTLFLTHRMSWAEEGLRVVIGVMLTGEGKVSDYLPA